MALQQMDGRADDDDEDDNSRATQVCLEEAVDIHTYTQIPLYPYI